jgi:hypothetical protein
LDHSGTDVQLEALRGWVGGWSGRVGAAGVGRSEGGALLCAYT